MSDHEIYKKMLLEEWKERYISYRAYRGQYLTVLSITATGWLVGFVFAFREVNGHASRFAILSIMLSALVMLIYAHWIARNEIQRLGDRIDDLEKRLGMNQFRTTRLLERALKGSTIASIFAFVITLGFLIFFITIFI